MKNKEEILKKFKEYIKLTTQYNEILKDIYLYKEQIMNFALKEEITEKDFYFITSILSSQSRSPFWQNYFIKKINAKKIKASENKGDFKWNNNFYEFKISGFNKDSALHVVQIRIWQNCNYVIVYLDPQGNSFIFILSHDQMKQELKVLKATPAHGTKEANRNNEKIEYRFTLRYESPDFTRWLLEYKVEDEYFQNNTPQDQKGSKIS